jgi:glycosyltransferase involved in cell wall biosynthesis
MHDRSAEHVSGANDQPVQHRWHVIASEYPPDTGGVGDYTCGVASGLAAHGDEVHVWCPAGPDPSPQAEGVFVHRELGSLTVADLRRAGLRLNRFPGPRRILVQWVPHGYGYRSMNVAFCWWLWHRARRHGDQVEIMAHEAYLTFHPRLWKQNVAALVHRLMTILLLRAAQRVWVAIPDWEKRWRPYTLGRDIPFEWLPVPSNVPVVDNPDRARAVRERYVGGGGFLIGHFGTHGVPVTSLLEPILMALGETPAHHVILLMGAGSEEYRDHLLRIHPSLAGVIQATGPLAAGELSSHLAACDLFMQPYPDGVSSRRGSFMAGLSHGKPIVTTSGHLTEPFWSETGALALAPAGETRTFVDLLRRLEADAVERARMGHAARALYQQRFDISHVVATLRDAAGVRAILACAS